jgi:tRNA threonylcarbamoyladenosine biosynthesis protein TsaB
MDARRSQVYTAFYKWEANNLQKLTEYMAISIEECIEKVKLYNKTVVFLGDGVPVHKEYIQTIFEKEQLLFAPASCNMQRASSIASLALLRAKEGEIQSHLAFVPFYLRKSQAEREYEEKQRKKTL